MLSSGVLYLAGRNENWSSVVRAKPKRCQEDNNLMSLCVQREQPGRGWVRARVHIYTHLCYRMIIEKVISVTFFSFLLTILLVSGTLPRCTTFLPSRISCLLN